ncbi:hypothetical protein DL95DRAFT_392788, partial [Leptodontidium sp. 2 PMI_412]
MRLELSRLVISQQPAFHRQRSHLSPTAACKSGKRCDAVRRRCHMGRFREQGGKTMFGCC